MAENKIIIGKDITINDAREDFFNEIKPLASEVEQEVIEAEQGTTVEEKSITVEDVDVSKEHSISVKGNLSQESEPSIENPSPVKYVTGEFESYNILNAKTYSNTDAGLNISANDKGILKINGTPTRSCYVYFNNINFKEGKTYTGILRLVGGNIEYKENVRFVITLHLIRKFNTEETRARIFKDSNSAIGKVIPDEDTNIQSYLFIAYDDSHQAYGTFNNAEFEIMILEGDYTKDNLPSYLPYGTIKNTYEVKMQNKNLFDLNIFFNNFVPYNCTKELLTNGIKLNFANRADAYIGVGGKYPNTYTTNKALINVKPNTKYTLICSSSPKNYVNFIDKKLITINKDYVSIPSNMAKSIYKFTTPENCKYISLRFGIDPNHSANISSYEFTDIGLYEGDYNEDYITHEEVIKNLDIPEEYALYGEEDYFYKKLGKWYVHNEYSKVALKELDWITSNTLNDKTRYVTHSLEGKILGALNNDTKVKNAKCTILSIVTAGQTYSETEGLSVSNSGYTVIFIDDLSTEITTDKFMELLENTNAYLVYQLQKPIEIEITNSDFSQQLDDLYNAEIYEGVTHIDTTTEYEDMVELPNLNLHYNYVTPAPSPNRPSEYKYVEGKQTIVQRNENLINYPYDKDSQERDGIKFEVNNDGTITVNGTATGNATLVLNYTTKELRELLLNNNCFLSGCPSGGSSSSYRLQLYGYTFEGKYALMDSGNGVSLSRFENANNDFNIAIVINTGTTVNNLVFKPKLEIGDKATDYILPQKQTYELDLPYKLALLGDISDSYEITTSGDDFKIVENIVYHKNFDEAVLKDLDWFLGTTADNYTKFSTRSLNTKIISVLTNKDIFSGKCNILNILSANSTHTKNDGISLNTEKALTCYIDDLSTETDTTKFMQLLTDTNAKLLYPLRNTEDIQIDKSSNSKFYEQVQRLINGSTFDGVNHFMVSAENDVPMNLLLSYTTEYDKEYDFYIDKNNKYFIVPEADIKYIIDPNESDLKNMPEATESTVTIAGRDGDLVLNTRYEPRNYDIIAYTEENLSAEEKQVEINKLKTFINSMKKKTKKFALLANDEFIPVKYNSQMKVQEYPKSVRFEIPLKSSKSYTNNLTKTRIFGAGTDISNTIEPTGCIITIQGPATTPKISLNDYQMQYDNVILSGNKLVIDTNNSTVTHITSSGVRTNAAIYYNHEYPKIQPGVNEIKILSGIANNEQVLTEWYDLKI